MKGVAGQRGFFSITTVLMICAVVAVIYAGISFARPYIRYNTLRMHTTDILESELKSLPAIKGEVLKDAEELKIPLDEENIEVTVSQAKVIKVKATWSETVNFWDFYKKQLDFVMEVDY
jgi:hypothetical protein